MGSAICAGVLFLAAFASYTRWQKEKKTENINSARIWMIVSALSGAGAVIAILAFLFGFTR